MIHLPLNPVKCIFCQQFIINNSDHCHICNVTYFVSSRNIIQEIFIIINNSCRVKFSFYNKQSEVQLLSNNYYKKYFNINFDCINLPLHEIHNKINSLLYFL